MHAPLAQPALATLGCEPQALPHSPQCDGFDRRSTSQPFEATPSQFKKYDCEQPEIAQLWFPALPLQTSNALGKSQAIPQPLHCCAVPRRVSQFLLLLSQSAQSGAHRLTSHVPLWQVALAFAIEQPAPHVPQFASSVSGVSQPSLKSPLQSPHSASQLGRQRPLSQLSPAACGVGVSSSQRALHARALGGRHTHTQSSRTFVVKQ